VRVAQAGTAGRRFPTLSEILTNRRRRPASLGKSLLSVGKADLAVTLSGSGRRWLSPVGVGGSYKVGTCFEL
jgi:hypothetical protein